MSKIFLRHTLTKKILTSLSLYIFTIWKCIAYNFFCRDGIYFDKILVSKYKLFKRSNKANWMFVIVGKCYFSNEAVHRGGNMLFRFLWRLPYLQSYDSIFSMVHCGYFVYKTKESNLVCRMCTTTLDTNGWIPAADFFFNMKMFVKNNQIKSIL
jgi:hypothetical protein